MKKTPLILALVIFALTACAPTTIQPIATHPGNIVPNPTDLNLSRGNVFLDSIELLTMESYPPQFMLALKGSLPTPCHKLRIAVSPPDSQNKIVVDVYSVVDPNMICTQVLEPFEENFPLGSFPSGHYTLWVNGEQIAEFDS